MICPNWRFHVGSLLFFTYKQMEKPQVLEVMQRKYVLDFATLQNLGKNVILEQLCPFLFYVMYGIVLLVIDERTNG